MAYYQKAPQKKRKINYAEQGSWKEEGSEYRKESRRSDETRAAGNRFSSSSGSGKDSRNRIQENRSFRENKHESRKNDRFGPERNQTERKRRIGDPPDRAAQRRSNPYSDASEMNKAAGYKDLEYQDKDRSSVRETAEKDWILCGRNPIREALRSEREIEKLLVQKGELSGSAREIVQEARARKIMVQEVDKRRLDEIALHHQGLIAFASEYHYADVEEMLQAAAERGEDPFLIILDGVTDPHNLGAIIRTAECAGAHGVIIPLHRSVGLTPTAVKASAGAIEHMKVARVTNLNRTIEDLKRQGIWIYAVTMSGKDYEKVDFKGGTALVIGSEGEGISRLTAEKCDLSVSLPMKGNIDSLNASVAAGIVMYRVLHCRKDR